MITRKPDPTKKLYKTKKWRWISQMVIDREHNTCQFCHKPIENTFNIHHIEVATLANFYDMDNLMLLHVECQLREINFTTNQAIVGDNDDITFGD